jgi:hypothetical protein
LSCDGHRMDLNAIALAARLRELGIELDEEGEGA